MPAHDVDSLIELHCEHCGYNVANVPHRRCPECGAIFDPHALRLTYDRAKRTLRQARRHFFTVPLVGGVIVGMVFGLARSDSAAIASAALYFIVAGYLVALATILAPDVVQARKALGRHGGAGETRLILMYEMALVALQLAVMTGMAALTLAIIRAVR